MNGTQLFHQYRNQIRALAWKYSRMWGLDPEEMELQGNLIFAEALTLYDPKYGADFHTFLYSRLQKLNDFATSESRRRAAASTDAVPSLEPIGSYATEAPDVSRLSNEGKQVWDFLSSFEWHGPGRQKPSLTLVQRAFQPKGWVLGDIKDAWEEVGHWFQTGAYA